MKDTHKELYEMIKKRYRGDVILWLTISAVLTVAVALEHSIVVAALLGMLLSSYVVVCILGVRIMLSLLIGFFVEAKDKNEKS
jgi:cobalamin biosynthesis protein CobD/CbiB